VKVGDLPVAGYTPCEVSVIIKALNEEGNIARTLQFALAAVAGRNAEVILADSLSTDRTVEIARTFPIQIVQLSKSADRGCGVGAQLGYQFSRGRFVLVTDGDMDLQREFVDAGINRLLADPSLGGVGGSIVDVNMDNIEYRARQARAPRDAFAGPVDRLNGGGLFRRTAIESIEYLTNRNLHACEELEQALRLQSAGWRMERLALIAVYHHGHTAATWSLMSRRWSSRYVCGAGELLRSAVGKPYFWNAVRTQRHLFVVLGWWGALALLLTIWLTNNSPIVGISMLTLAALPVVLMSWRRHSLALGIYSVAAWCLDAAGLIRGLSRKQLEPTERIEARSLVTNVSPLKHTNTNAKVSTK